MADQDYRGLGRVSDDSAPPFDRSRSEGDLRRFSYRDSAFNRLTLQAVANDDGTAITAATDALLREILEELRALRAQMEK